MTVSLSSRSKLISSEVNRAMPIPKSEESDCTDLLLHWLTIFSGTVIISFPNSWDQRQSYGLKKKLDEEIKTNKKRDLITSVDHLVHLIIKLSVDLLRQDGPGTIKFQEAFLSSISNIVSKLHENQSASVAHNILVRA